MLNRNFMTNKKDTHRNTQYGNKLKYEKDSIPFINTFPDVGLYT